MEEIVVEDKTEKKITFIHCKRQWDEDLNFCGLCGEKLDKRNHLNWKSENCCDRLVPRYTINLDEPAKKRWKHVIADYKNKFPDLVKFMETEVAKTLGGTLTSIGKSLINSVFSIAAKSGAAYLADELEGIAEASGIGVGILLAVQLAYEMCACCTSIVAQDSDGIPYHVRTMDWAIPMLQEFTIEVDFMQNGKIIYSASTWAGYIGILTGIKPKAFSISINYRSVGKNPIYNLINTLSMSWPIGYVVRQVLETCSTYSNVYLFLQKVELISPVYITIAGIKKDEACLITRSPSKSEHFISLENGLKSEDDSKLVYLAKNEKFIVQTNCDWWLLKNLKDDDTILYSKARVEKAIKKFKTLKTINEEEIANKIFVGHPIINSLTVYITAMVPKNSYLSTRLTF